MIYSCKPYFARIAVFRVFFSIENILSAGLKGGVRDKLKKNTQLQKQTPGSMHSLSAIK